MPLFTSHKLLLKCDEASGSFLDASGLGYDFTDHNSCGSTTGQISNARTFNGSTQYASKTSNTDLQSGDNDKSFSLWVYFPSTVPTGNIIFCKGDTFTGVEYALGPTTGGGTHFTFYYGSGSKIAVSTTLTTGVWYHVICIHDSVNNLLRVIVNGIEDNVSYSSGATAGSGDVTIGAGTQLGSIAQYANCYIDEFAVWNKVLSAAEIEDLYNDGYGLALSDWGKPDSPSAELTTSLMSYWSMKGTSGSNESDETASANTLTQTNTVGSAAGKVGNCRTFTKSAGNYLSHADNASLSGGDIFMSFAAWVNLSVLSSESDIISKGDLFGTLEYRLFETNTDTRFELNINGTIVKADNLGAPSSSIWYLLIAWHDPTQNLICITVNAGTPNTNSYSSGITDGTADLVIGGRTAFGSKAGNVDGSIDEVGVWKKRLYPWERRYLYNSGSGRAYSDFAGGGGGGGMSYRGGGGARLGLLLWEAAGLC